jgi:hypothetical protein
MNDENNIQEVLWGVYEPDVLQAGILYKNQSAILQLKSPLHQRACKITCYSNQARKLLSSRVKPISTRDNIRALISFIELSYEVKITIEDLNKIGVGR